LVFGVGAAIDPYAEAMRTTAEVGTAPHSEAYATAIAAARRCFRRFGVDKTTMDDVAKEAGMARSRLYKTIATRQEVIEGAVLDRLGEIAAEIRPLLTRSTNLSDALVTGSLATTKAARSDPELTNLIETAGTIRMHTLLTGSDPLAQDILLVLWRDVFDRARKAGELRHDATDAELIEWLSGVQMMLTMREDLKPDRERQLLEKFFLPAFIDLKPGA
jgi:AcrR family transcriptional regulator